MTRKFFLLHLLACALGLFAVIRRKPSRPEWQVFEMNDCDWWVARSLEEAKRSALEYYGGDYESMEGATLVDGPEMDRLRFMDDMEDPHAENGVRSFREELARRIRDGLSEPELFASTEY